MAKQDNTLYWLLGGAAALYLLSSNSNAAGAAVGAAKSTNSTVINPIKAGDLLTIRFIGDSDLIKKATVLSRKGNFAVIDLGSNEIVRRKIYNYYNEYEYLYPYGKYSMAPIAKHGKAAR